MRRLSGLDRMFLDREEDGLHGHMTAVQFLDPSTAPEGEFSTERLLENMERRLDFTPLRGIRLTQDLPAVGNTYLVNGPRVNVADHVFEVTCKSPGNDQALSETISEIHSRPLDRSRPLWDWYVIRGLNDGRIALIGRSHHAFGDGIVQAASMGLLFDFDAEGSNPLDTADPPDWELDQQPSRLEALKSIPKRTIGWAGSVRRAVKNMDQLPGFRGLPGASTLARVTGHGEDWIPVQPTVFNGPLGHDRTAAFFSVPLVDVKALKNEFHTTVNDIAVATVAGGIRRYLDAKGELPEDPMVAVIPVSVRNETDPLHGNRIQFPVAPIPTDEPDPKLRIARVSEATGKMKARTAEMPRRSLEDAATALPARWANALNRLPGARPPANVIISNVPFPPIPLYVAGAKVDSGHLISHLLEGIGLTILITNGHDKINFGICGDASMLPDAWELASDVAEEFDQLTGLL